MAEITEITDEELAAEALAADPDGPVEDGAVPFGVLTGGDGAEGAALLPSWYMPSAVRPLRGWSRWVVAAIIVSFVLINALGLCSTYGWVSFG